MIPDSMSRRLQIHPSLSILCLLLALLTPLSAMTATPPGLYQVEVPVADRSPASRQSALQQAMVVLAIRLSGDRTIAERSEVQSLVDAASRYVQQYQYVTQPAQDSAAAPELSLSVMFDGTAVAGALRAAGLPVWGHERPELLAWIAVDENGRRRLLAAGEESNLRHSVDQVARQRGLVLLLPLLDLEEQSRVRVSDVWGGFVEDLRDASARYGAQGILLGRIMRDGDGWRGRWLLDYASLSTSWVTQGDTLDAALREGLEQLADRQATRMAVQGGSALAASQSIIVTGIDGLDSYARVSHYLRGLSVVKQVELIRVSGDQMELMLGLNGQLIHLNQAIRLGNLLEPVAEVPVPVYRLR